MKGETRPQYLERATALRKDYWAGVDTMVALAPRHGFSASQARMIIWRKAAKEGPMVEGEDQSRRAEITQAHRDSGKWFVRERARV